MGRELHPVEAELASLLERGVEPSVQLLGGISVIEEAAEALGPSPLMPALLSALLAYWQNAGTAHDAILQRILSTLLENAKADFVLMEAIDLLDSSRPLPGASDETCFTIFLAKARRNHNALSGLARSASLDAALRWSTSNRRWQFRLLDFLLGLTIEDDPEFLRHAAKIIGVAYAHWREDALIPKLREISAVEAVNVDVLFELGMVSLVQGLDAPDPGGAQCRFKEAKGWFTKTDQMSEGSAEARLYTECLEVLSAYRNAEDVDRLKERCERVRKYAFELAAYQGGPDRPSWIGERHAEALSWSSLASTLTALAGDLEEAGWWEPAVVVENHILTAYSASRTIMRRGSDGTLDSLIRPRIEATLARHEGQAFQLKAWLKRNPSHLNSTDAMHLISQVDQLFEKGRNSPNPFEAVAGLSPVAALIDKAQLPEQTKRVLMEVTSSAFALQVDNMTVAECNVIESCRKIAGTHPDHQCSTQGRRLYDAVLLWTVRFLSNRLEVTQKDDQTVVYLFERPDGSLAHEGELQDDYFRWLATAASSSDLEPTNVGGGRADVRLRYSNERIVIEVKRELADASFDALAAWYAGQTTDYQNVSIRLGFLLVLDLSIDNREGTPHLTALFQTRLIHRTGEDVPRIVTIVKVPGRRKRPGDLTKAAKGRKTLDSGTGV